jgi:hypothetical protein
MFRHIIIVATAMLASTLASTAASARGGLHVGTAHISGSIAIQPPAPRTRPPEKPPFRYNPGVGRAFIANPCLAHPRGYHGYCG